MGLGGRLDLVLCTGLPVFAVEAAALMACRAVCFFHACSNGNAFLCPMSYMQVYCGVENIDDIKSCHNV